MKRKVTGILFLIVGLSLWSPAQQADLYPYFPAAYSDGDWKGRVDVFWNERSASNSFTNEFLNTIRSSGYLDPEMKNKQISQLEDKVLTGNIRSAGAGVFLKGEKLFYYAGVEHQQVLDTRLDDKLIQLLMLGNKPFAGETLAIESSDYTNTYFNRILAGVGYEMDKGDLTHTFFGKAAFTSGQNYEDIHVDQASLYTHPDGDYLDVGIKADTRLGDTVWADVFTVNGLGASVDLSYTLQKENDFYVSFTAKNLGFITWNRNPYAASVDTSFHFEGVSADTSSAEGGIPDDFSYKNLRSLIFKNPDDTPFTTGLPVKLNLNGGKYFSDGRYYAGANLCFYPALQASYFIEVFGTWNYHDRFQLTPIFSYSSYGRMNVGLSASVKVGNNLYLQAGTAFLDSYLNRDASVASGGFVKAVVVW